MGASRPLTRHRPLIPALAALLAAGFVTLSVATTVWQQERLTEQRRDQLAAEAHDQERVLEHYFSRAEALTQVLGQNSAFSDFYRLDGSRLEKVRAGGRFVRETNQALAQLEKLFPGQVGEACFIDDGGAENARAVRGQIAPISELSTSEAQAPFFGPSFTLRDREVFQSQPYVSPDTHNRVIANATPVALPARQGQAIVHFEVSLRSFERQASAGSGELQIAVIDRGTGKVVFNTDANPGEGGVFASLAGDGPRTGQLEVEGRPAAYAQVETSAQNANDWIVVASAPAPLPSWIEGLGLPQIALIAMALALLAFAVVSLRRSQTALHRAALTDPLTSLGNRRKLVVDLTRRFESSSGAAPLMLAIYDLDGFKSYNDSFGHPAGDALLTRLASALQNQLEAGAEAYRIGGDEFCLLASGIDCGEVLAIADRALMEEGEGFTITSSAGFVMLPADADNPEDALQLADRRMYASKGVGRSSAGRQTTDVLVRLLAERHPELGSRNSAVQELCEQVMDELKSPSEDRMATMQAAALHDIGKLAVPDSILHKPGPLDEDEWAFIRQHTVIGERILAAAPALAGAAKLVRWCHERFDGAGYPDGLNTTEIPLGARIIAVCDSFDAMTSDRPYSPARSADDAVAELRRCAGTQFDPAVVEAFTRVVSKHASRVAATA